MARISWNQAGDRYYELGVDRGVLYPLNPDGTSWSGIAWNGLTTVTESPSGAEAQPYYIDGVKYSNTLGSEEFGGTIEAFTYPEEFYELDGTTFTGTGLGFGQQPRKAFALSYRTKLGNDVQGESYGYKIHLIYNAMASPSERSNASETDSLEPLLFSWAFTTTPIAVQGLKELAHIIIDSSKTSPFLLNAVEEMLYGTELMDAHIPMPDELVELFRDWPSVQVTDNGDGSFTITGPDTAFSFPSSTEFVFTGPSATYIDSESYSVTSF